MNSVVVWEENYNYFFVRLPRPLHSLKFGKFPSLCGRGRQKKKNQNAKRTCRAFGFCSLSPFALVTRRPYCPGGPKKLSFTTPSLTPMVSTARLGVVKQSSFGLAGQYGRSVTREIVLWRSRSSRRLPCISSLATIPEYRRTGRTGRMGAVSMKTFNLWNN